MGNSCYICVVVTQNKTFHTKTNEDMEQKIEKTKVYNVIIMDRSGSMWDIQKPAIMGFNEVLRSTTRWAARSPNSRRN